MDVQAPHTVDPPKLPEAMEDTGTSLASGILPPISPPVSPPSSFTPELPQGSVPKPDNMEVSPPPSVSRSPRIFLDICSGSTRPLSTAMLNNNKDVLSIDILICNEMDLLNDKFYLSLLRLCASGIVAYTACSPSCAEYSRLKLKPGGPPALR